MSSIHTACLKARISSSTCVTSIWHMWRDGNRRQGQSWNYIIVTMLENRPQSYLIFLSATVDMEGQCNSTTVILFFLAHTLCEESRFFFFSKRTEPAKSPWAVAHSTNHKVTTAAPCISLSAAPWLRDSLMSGRHILWCRCRWGRGLCPPVKYPRDVQHRRPVHHLQRLKTCPS